MKRIIYLIAFICLPITASAQTFEEIVQKTIHQAVDSAISDKVINLDQLLVKIDSLVKVNLKLKPNTPSVTDVTPDPDAEGILALVSVDDIDRLVRIEQGETYEFWQNATIRALGYDGPVNMSITGPINESRVESAEPFYLFGDIGETPNGRNFPPGEYTVRANGDTIKFTIRD